MRTSFYLMLAWTGMKKNRKLYLPYLLTCAGMIMMYYLVGYLSVSPVITKVRGGSNFQALLTFGVWVIAVFAVIFLFYSNSFLIRRRKKEFGLYNILGMGKVNIGRILIHETLLSVLISMVAGLATGILASKLGELVIVRLLQGSVTFSLAVMPDVIIRTCLVFPCIFLLIFLFNILNVQLSNPIELLHSENAGEKAPKANWFFGLLGFIILGVAYYIAVTIQQPVAALAWFFVAVIMVIVATYLIFIAGSVLMCSILKKNKEYYYKTQHFISVSSMMYRMKRNGAGLASICILATMVLVMLSSTSCLFFGIEDSVKTRYPDNININAYFENPEEEDAAADAIRSFIASEIEKLGVQPVTYYDYSQHLITASFKDGHMEWDVNAVDAMNQYTLEDVFQVAFISYSDYARLAGIETDVAGIPGNDEFIVFGDVEGLNYRQVTFPDGSLFHLNVIETPAFARNSGAELLPLLFFVAGNPMDVTPYFCDISMIENYSYSSSSFCCGFDLDLDADSVYDYHNTFRTDMRDSEAEFNGCYSLQVTSNVVELDSAYADFGGLFVLGIMLSIVFLFATILIVYYKQISEGYEDQSRFEIMQKVGMTKKDIRRSINSQMLTVFFLPLAGAGLHLAFAFPMIQKMMLLFGLMNLPLLITTAVISYLAFAVFYVVVYKITTNAYYGIAVSR